MFNFIKRKLFGITTVTTQKVQFYTYNNEMQELILEDEPSEYPAHLIVKDDFIFLYIGDQMKRILEARIFSNNMKDMNKEMGKALQDPSQIYEILGVENSTGLKKYSVQKMGTADRMEIHISDKFFSLHSDYDHKIDQYRSVSQFFEN